MLLENLPLRDLPLELVFIALLSFSVKFTLAGTGAQIEVASCIAGPVSVAMMPLENKLGLALPMEVFTSTANYSLVGTTSFPPKGAIVLTVVENFDIRH